MKYAVLWAPDFALQAVLRPEPELRLQPVALITEQGPRGRVFQATFSALQEGVLAGMAPSQAQARCPRLLFKTRSPAAEDCAKAAMLECALGVSPWVEDTGAGVCSLRWEPGFGADPARLLEALAKRSLKGCLGLAPNPDLAWLAAQAAALGHGPVFCREIRESRELHPCPLKLLTPPAHLSEVLDQWGIRTIGDFVALGRDALLERLGPEIAPVFERAVGRMERPLRQVTTPERYEEHLDLEHAIETLEPLLFLIRRCLGQLVLRLGSAWLVAGEIHLRLGFASGGFYQRIFSVPSPTGDEDVLFGMLHTHLESFRAEHPLTALGLSAVPSRAPRQQFALFESALRDPHQFFETLARLQALLGEDRVGRPELEPTRRPDCFRMRPVSAAPAEYCPPAEALPGALGLSLRRFRPLVAARVQCAPQPVFVESAEVNGPVLAVQGPVVLSGDWWDRAAWSHREWDVELRGGVLCRLREEPGGWFVEGIYD
jgi:protein ImuB